MIEAKYLVLNAGINIIPLNEDVYMYHLIMNDNVNIIVNGIVVEPLVQSNINVYTRKTKHLMLNA